MDMYMYMCIAYATSGDGPRVCGLNREKMAVYSAAVPTFTGPPVGGGSGGGGGDGGGGSSPMNYRALGLATAAAVVVATATLYAHHRRRRLLAAATARAAAAQKEQPGIIFTGTGCSSGLPLVPCLLGQLPPLPDCAACQVALRHGHHDKNWRGNVSVLLRFVDPASGQQRNVQIDCGKTFREVVACKVYRAFGIKGLDALLLTHDHMDAVGGLDELRSLQLKDPVTLEIAHSLRCICDRRTLSRLRHAFPYLFPKPPNAAPFGGTSSDAVCQCCELDLEGVQAAATGATAGPPSPPAAPPTVYAASPPTTAPPPPVVKRFVAKIGWESFGSIGADGQPLPRVAVFNVCGLEVHALPAQHGADYVCFGFGFGPADERVVYLSDYTTLLPATEEVLYRWSEEGSIALLVLDALRWASPHPVHACALESIELARKLRARRTLLVGMSHGMEHEGTNARLRSLLAVEGLDVQLAYDGQFVPLRFF